MRVPLHQNTLKAIAWGKLARRQCGPGEEASEGSVRGRTCEPNSHGHRELPRVSLERGMG